MKCPIDGSDLIMSERQGSRSITAQNAGASGWIAERRRAPCRICSDPPGDGAEEEPFLAAAPLSGTVKLSGPVFISYVADHLIWNSISSSPSPLSCSML